MSLPQPFWAVILAMLGTSVAVCVLFHKADVNLSLGVLAVGSNLVSGALGAFAGHAANSSKTDVNPGNAPVTINQGQPLGK